MRWFALLILFDLQNLLSRFKKIVHVYPWLPASDDYTVLVPVYGHPRYLQNRDYLETIKPNVVVVTEVSVPVMQAFASELEEDGWRVCRVVCTTRPPGPPEMLCRALNSGCVETTYAVRLDGDSYPEQPLGRAITAIARAGLEVCSVKVVVRNRERLIERLQAVEYDMAMLSRHFRPWLTSDACHIAKTAALKLCLNNHSRWFPGEDTEVGRLAQHYCLRIGHCDLRVSTEVPSTFGHWFRQRRAWWAGNFRHTFQNLDLNIRYVAWMAYYVGLVWLLLAGKLLAFSDSYRAIPVIILAYTAVTVVANWQVRTKWMIAYPYYALFQVIVMPLVGAAYYLWLCYKRRRTGRYLVGLRKEPMYFTWIGEPGYRPSREQRAWLRTEPSSNVPERSLEAASASAEI